MLGFRRELMPVGHKHFPFVEQRAEFCRDELKRIVVVVRGFGAQDLKPFFDCQVRTDNNAAAGKRSSDGTFPRLQNAHAISIAITTVLPLPVAILQP